MEKRILIYTNHYYPENFKINEITKWIEKKKFSIRVITAIPNYPSGKFFNGYGLFKKRYEKKDNIIINRLFVIPRGNGGYIRIILNYVSYFISCFFFTIYIAIFKKKYDIIFVHHTSPPLIIFHTLIYGLFHNTKNILWELDLWPETLNSLNILNSKIINNLIELTMKKLYNSFDIILVGSYGFLDIIKSRFNKSVHYFPNWANSNIEENIIVNCPKMNIPDDHFKIMYTGNIGYSQNFDLIHELMVLKKTEKIFWIFIGDGRFKTKFKKLIEKNNLSKYIFINSIESKFIPWYQNNSDCLLLSLDSKGIFKQTVPAKLQSYMCAGKPIFAIIEGEASNIIKESDCGFTCSPGDKNQISKKIQELIRLNKKDLIKFGKNARNYYNRKFHSNKRKKQLLNLFK